MLFSKTKSSFFFALLLATVSSTNAQISRQECMDQGGTVVGDVGNGAIFQPDYLCEINDEPPSDSVVAQDGEPIASEGEVCCGGTGEGIAAPGGGGLEGGGLEEEDFGFPDLIGVDREEMTRQECGDERNGTVVGDIGNGVIFQEDYVCESNGQPPIGNIDQTNEEAVAIEGEVCCGPPVAIDSIPDEIDPDDTVERVVMNRQECADQNGVITGDIGNGAIHRSDYLCESNGESPIGTIVPLDGEPIAREGEVCCGPATDTETAEVTSDADNNDAPSTTEAAKDAASGGTSFLCHQKLSFGSLLLAAVYAVL